MNSSLSCRAFSYKIMVPGMNVVVRYKVKCCLLPKLAGVREDERAHSMNCKSSGRFSS